MLLKQYISFLSATYEMLLKLTWEVFVLVEDLPSLR